MSCFRDFFFQILFASNFSWMPAMNERLNIMYTLLLLGLDMWEMFTVKVN